MKRVLLAVVLVCGCGETVKQNLFPPEEQEPFFEKGLILPPNSLECISESTGVPQTDCNHHGSTVAVLPDGTVGVVWFHGEAEKSHDSWNVFSKLEPDADSWTEPVVIFDEPGKAEGNAALWVKSDGTLAVVFVTIFGRDWWDDSRIRMIESGDDGETWSEPIMLREEYCWMVRHRPLRLKSGQMVLPLYDECWSLPVFMYSKDEFNTFWEQEVEGQYQIDHSLKSQPALIQRSDGSVAAIMRDGSSTRRIFQMSSDDQGRTWSMPEPTQLPNSDTSVDWVRLLDGHVVAVFNNSPDVRFPLAAALSTDEGRTFTAVRHLNDECVSDEGECSYHYPSITQSPKDGTIWVSYTHKRETIGWIHFNEAWLMQGGDELNTNPLP
jgi:predicted neuraminidase